MKKILFSIILLFVFTGTALSDTNGKNLIVSGINAYKDNGAKAAIEAWIKGSSLEGSKEALSQANVLRQIEDFYGNYLGFEIIKEHKISERTYMFLFLIYLENGPIFGRFQTYQSSDEQWIATHFQFHTQSPAIWPDHYVYGK